MIFFFNAIKLVQEDKYLNILTCIFTYRDLPLELYKS
jgi:hypothetical protein